MQASLRMLALALAAVLAAGCGKRDPAPPPRDPDPMRIVVLSPAIAVVLSDLGLRDRIVGRHGYDMVLDKSIPVCGEQNAVNYEALLRANPTHVFTEWGTREYPARLTSLAESKGWVLRDFRMLTLADIDAAARSLAELLPDADPSDRVTRVHALAAPAEREPVWEGRVLLLMDASPIAAIGPGSAHHELLLRSGGVPAIAEGSPYMRLHAEDVARLAPDAIILIQPRSGVEPAEPEDAGAPADAELRARLGVIASLDIPAVTSGRFAVIDYPLGLLPSTALADVADRIESLLARWSGQ